MRRLAQSIATALAVAITMLSGAGFGPQPCAGQEAKPPPESKATEAKGAPPVDFFGDPLPPGALARMGTARLRGQVLTFSADNQTLITVGADLAFHYWDVADGKERHRKQLSLPFIDGRFDVIHQHKGVSADGQRYVTHDKELIRVWDTATGKELRKFADLSSSFGGKSLTRLAVSNDGQMVAAALLDFNLKKCPVYLWNAATGKEHQFIFEEKDYARSALSPDGKTLIVAGAKGMIRFYETATAKELRQIKTEPITVNPSYPVVSSDNNTLAWLDGDRKIKLWNIADGTEKASFEIPELGINYHLAFARDGKHVALATEKGVLIWDTTARKEIHRIPRPETQSFIGAQMGALAFSPDGKTLAVSRPDGARLYDVATGKLLIQPMGLALTRTLSLAFAPDGASLAAATEDDPAIHLWESATGKPLLRIKSSDHTQSLLFAPDGKQLLIGDRIGAVHFWNAKSGEPVRKLEINDDKDAKIKYAITRLATHGKALIALGSRFEGKLHSRHMVWDLATGNVAKRTDFPGDFGAKFGPTGITLHAEDKIILRDAVSGKQVARLNEPSVGPFSFSRDGKRIAIGLPEAATILDLATGRVLAKIPTGKMGDLELSPDGKFLAAINREEMVLWEIATGKPAYRLPAPAPFSAADGVPFSIRAAFAPDGRRLATGLKDTTVLIWNIAPGFLSGTEAATRLGPKDLEQLWSDLASADAAIAYRAIWTLAGSPGQAVPFVKNRLKPADDDGKRIAKLIIALGSEKFPVRNAAFEELKNLDIEIEPAFQRAFAAGVTLECRRRMEAILELPPAIIRGREILRGVRAVTMLEASGAPAARQFLQDLAKGAADARLTQEAKDSLVRLQ